MADDVVELVAHAAGPGHVGHAAGSVELAVQDVVQHAARVPDLEAARLDPAPAGPAYSRRWARVAPAARSS